MSLRRFFKKEKQEHRIMREAVRAPANLLPNITAPRRSVRIPSAGACTTP